MEKDLYYQLITEGAMFQEALSSCSSLGGTMPLPRDEVEMAALREAVIGKNPGESCDYLWIPIVQDNKNATR